MNPLRYDTVLALCDELGIDPTEVIRITIDPHTTTVEQVMVHNRGAAEDDGLIEYETIAPDAAPR